MDVDEVLRRSGAAWRAGTASGPVPQVRDVLGAPGAVGQPPRARSRRWTVPLWAAAGIAAVALLMIVNPHAGTEPATSYSGAPSASASGPDRSAIRPPACGARQLRPRVGTGAAAGTTYLAVRLRNVSSSPCWLSGFPAVSGVTPAGRAVRLDLTHDSRSAPDSSGPGAIEPGADGVVDVGLNSACTRAPVRYERLQIVLAGGSSLTVAAPPELTALAPCGGTQGEAGRMTATPAP
jgi:hypothetical protein